MYNQGHWQRLPPPPPRPPFQQGPPPYAHASSAIMQLCPPVSVPPSGNTSRSFSILPPPPPPEHGSTSTPHSYSTISQSSSWNQSQLHNLPPLAPPFDHHLASRIPPPHLQGQSFYGAAAPPLLPGGIQGLQQAPPPPPPSSSYFTPVPFGSFPQPTHELSMGNLPPPPPPPPSSPPPGPPPLPPSSPPPDSPLHPSFTSPPTAAKHSPSPRNSSDVDIFTSAVVDIFDDTHHKSNDTVGHDDDLDSTGVNGSEVTVKDVSYINIMSDIPPPKPTEERTVRKIEVLCQYIAKNGHEFEDMTRRKEVGNPEFEFLFGGEPGSEAAVAHEYFNWMKRKCSSNDLFEGRQTSDMSLRLSGIGSSQQTDGTMHAGISHSPADSDMDMEDDITQPDELDNGKACGSANNEPVSTSNQIDTTMGHQASDAEHFSHKDTRDENLYKSEASGTVKQGANLSQDDILFERPLLKNCDADSERPLENKEEKHKISSHQEINQSNASSAAEVISSEVSGVVIKGISPFRLIQDYASDDSSENDIEPHLEDISPKPVPLQVKVKADTANLNDLQTDIGSKDSVELDKESGPLSASVPEVSLNTSKLPEPSKETKDVENKIDTSSASVDGGAFKIDFERKDRLAGEGNQASGRSEEDRNDNELKVDEFGRVIKPGASDSDSDDGLSFSGRRGRGRSRSRSKSRSRSPHERRRRSPRRRREKRSRSRSWSPKKRRSRSRSPYRHRGEAGGDRTRHDRSRQPFCFDFKRGKCFRGASCRYLHDSEKNEESRRHKNKHQYQEIPHKSATKSVHEHDEGDNQEIIYSPINVDRPLIYEKEYLETRVEYGINEGFMEQSQANLSDPLPQNSEEKLQRNNDSSSIGEHPIKQMSPPQTQSAAVEIYPPYQPPLSSENPQLPVPPASSWLPLPPPPPRPSHGFPLPQFQQNHLPPYPSQVFVTPYATELPTHLQGAYSTIHHTEHFRPTTFPLNYPMPQQLGDSNNFGEGNFARPQLPSGRMQTFSGESLPSGGLQVPSSEDHPYLPRYHPQNPSMNLRYTSGTYNPQGSRFSGHYNPYASTFDQPLSTKFSSEVFGQSQGVDTISSRNTNPSPTYDRYLTHNLPKSGGDQYDPLFDSIEPSSNSSKKRYNSNKNKIEDKSGSKRPLDIEENSKHKEAIVAASASVENDEFGETADAEVGAVENDSPSPSSPIDLRDVATGEIEIDQVKSPGKLKKSKDSRSTKLFKVALAEFVKEVLKPSWRQGNMSKEAFKTIVKKTVDKVSGAMKKHQLPKSQAKINQYIDSSQRKLTKLVMGYVDKYVKA